MMNYDISLALRFSLRHSNRPLSADVGETSRLWQSKQKCLGHRDQRDQQIMDQVHVSIINNSLIK